MKNLLYRFRLRQNNTSCHGNRYYKKGKTGWGYPTYIPAKSEVQLSLFDLFENEGSAIDIAKNAKTKKSPVQQKKTTIKKKTFRDRARQGILFSATMQVQDISAKTTGTSPVNNNQQINSKSKTSLGDLFSVNANTQNETGL
ncbi:hypothetical protein A0O34_21920 (plasmid) [Chryseobacterium glaciei]|uniref:Uncharacterized protein n=1 Tax=Chryseobacterium glaciei TaxID=1685010 RepID=A0A172Y1Z6_9FLAO|nr:hypothetical protein [Chryseobacterium glaciei]ANF53283.1 hypothetical protein A0O34_21920 [Chryseobacterium glaciei]